MKVSKPHIDASKYLGRKVGKLTAIAVDRDLETEKQSVLICLCECGNTIRVFPHPFIAGKKQSCGCGSFRGHKSDQRTKHPFYKTWKGMIDRCEQPKDKEYARYGGRGIKVCDEWHDFWKFVEWVNQSGREEGLTLDRIDNDGNYYPENCRWATRIQQMNNTSRNIMIEFEGKRQTLSAWARELNIHYETLRQRYQNGWSVERMMTEPVHGKER